MPFRVFSNFSLLLNNLSENFYDNNIKITFFLIRSLLAYLGRVPDLLFLYAFLKNQVKIYF